MLVCSFLGGFYRIYCRLFNPVRKELSGFCGPRLTSDCLSCYTVCSGVVDLVTVSVGTRILLVLPFLQLVDP